MITSRPQEPVAARDEAMKAPAVEPAPWLVVIGASAGGLRALSIILSDLSEGIPAAIVVVQHLDPRHRSLMAEILARRTGLDVTEASEGDLLLPGRILLAPPDRHVVVNPDATLSLSQSEVVRYVRPSADVLFTSAANVYGERVVAVVLTGTGSDGAMGVQAVKRMGGRVLTQDEASSDFFGMPSAAIKTGAVDHVLSLQDIGPAIRAAVAGDGTIA